MNLKTKTASRALAVILIAAAAILLAGCAPANKTMRDVIDDFISAVNDRDSSGVKDCFDDDVVNGNQASNDAWYSNYFPATDYEISTFDKSGDDVTVEFTSATQAAQVYYFEMTEKKATMSEGGTFYIRRIIQGSSSGSVILE